MRLGLTCVMTAIVAVTAAACDSANPTTPELNLTAKQAALVEGAKWKDAEHHRLAEKIAGYGGFYLTGNGTAVVYLKNVDSRAAAERHIRSELAIARIVPAAFEFRVAQYDFADLALWRSTFPQLLGSSKGLVFVGTSKRLNRVHVGVVDLATKLRVLEIAREHGIPQSAFYLEIVPRGGPEPLEPRQETTCIDCTEPPPTEQTLRSHTSTLEGGRRIYTTRGISGTGSGCTIWLVGRGVSGNSHSGSDWAMTSSHCTPSLNGSQFVEFKQPEADAGYVGEEWEDGREYFGTQYFDGYPWTCVYAEGCRQSDAALIRLNGSRSVGVGRIAKPKINSGSTTIDLFDPYFKVAYIYGSRLHPGPVLHKIGQRTGWTTGEVYDICYDMPGWPVDQYGNTVNIECASLGTYASDGGDSGAPIIKRDPYEGDIVVGMHIGTAGNWAVYTNPINIQSDWSNYYNGHSLLFPCDACSPPAHAIEWRFGK